MNGADDISFMETKGYLLTYLCGVVQVSLLEVQFPSNRNPISKEIESCYRTKSKRSGACN